MEIITKGNKDLLEVLRHDAAHVMAEAVLELYPDTQITIGPAIDNGFYYDFYKEDKQTDPTTDSKVARKIYGLQRNA